MQILQPCRRSGVFIVGIVLVTILLASCTASTDYQCFADRNRIGYTSLRRSNDSYSISYQGAEYSRQEQIYDYVLLRSAELTVECGYNYFVVVSNTDRTRKSYRYSSGTTTTTHRAAAAGSARAYTGYNAYTTGSSYAVKIPVFTLEIKMYARKEGVQVPADSIYEAAPLIIQLKAKHNVK